MRVISRSGVSCFRTIGAPYYSQSQRWPVCFVSCIHHLDHEVYFSGLTTSHTHCMWVLLHCQCLGMYRVDHELFVSCSCLTILVGIDQPKRSMQNANKTVTLNMLLPDSTHFTELTANLIFPDQILISKQTSRRQQKPTRSFLTCWLNTCLGSSPIDLSIQTTITSSIMQPEIPGTSIMHHLIHLKSQPCLFRYSKHTVLVKWSLPSRYVEIAGMYALCWEFCMTFINKTLPEIQPPPSFLVVFKSCCWCHLIDNVTEAFRPPFQPWLEHGERQVPKNLLDHVICLRSGRCLDIQQ